MSRFYTWTNYDTGVGVTMTSEDMEVAYNAIGVYPEELAFMLTGLDTDSYADLCETLDLDDTDDEDYRRCEAYHRLLNVTYPGDLDCEKNFRQGL